MDNQWWIKRVRYAVFAAFGLGCDDGRERTVDPDQTDMAADGGALDLAGLDMTLELDQALPSACRDPQPVVDAVGAPTGFVRCADGAINRAAAVACPGPPAGSTCDPEALPEGARLNCEVDADCADRPHGRCIGNLGSPGLEQGCFCSYGCQTDADCRDEQACVCLGQGSVCVTARCATDAECGSGECGLSAYDDGCGVERSLACRTAEDACRLDVDCDDGILACVNWRGAFNCESPGVCGRPIRGDGVALTAPASGRGDWASAPAFAAAGLAAHERRALAAHWARLAALEHASVASFARFTLQLMALGAPPDLVAAAQQAGLDEVVHARLCYGVAGQLAGEPVGPGPLSLAGVDLAVDPVTVLREVIVEACVGETLGAAEAFHLADRAADPALAAVWRQIADDELRHAALGWRTLRWLLGHFSGLVQHVPAALAAAEAEHLHLPDGGLHLPAFGLLGGAATRRLRTQVIRGVVHAAVDAGRVG
ncbi:MAG: ferritin-like domain-containing protein [Myxococcales bacterium]|nr:ferritin-like domain-containing protein [Myxococcales bacterium]